MAQDAASDAETIRLRAEACQQIIDDCIEGKIQATAVVGLLQQAGASNEEAVDYLKQLADRTAAGSRVGGEGNEGAPERRDPRESTPEGLTPDEADEFRQRRDALEEQRRVQDEELRRKAADSAAWALLRAKASVLQSLLPESGSSDPAQQLALLLGLNTASATSSLPASVLTAAPHLAKLGSSAGDAHLDSTWKLRQAYSGDKAIDAVVDIMQRQQLEEPIPRSIWKEIVQDRFVNFRKLFAAMEPGYDHHDEPKDFHGGFALVKKDQAVAKKPVVTEADWTRVFGTWVVGVTLVYPHREEELQGYRRIVMELFRAVPNDPSVAINFDVDVRARYAKEPFHMDDRNRINIPLFAQMFNTAHTPAKRPGSSALSPNNPKRANVACINWNYGRCADPCENRRKHGDCSECGGKHRARDVPACYAALQANKGKGAGYGRRTGGQGSTGA
jgi:hypothetical protein